MANKEALRALQQRLAERLQTVRQHAPERKWLAVDISGHGFLLPLEQAGEIFPLSPIQTLPHSQPWFLGVANLRGHLHGVVDTGVFFGLSARPARLQADFATKDTGGRLIALNASLQINVALLVDRLLGLRSASTLTPADRASAEGRPHFITETMVDGDGRCWYEIDLAALSADEAFLKIDA